MYIEFCQRRISQLGTSESLMHHPASDRSWPKIASHFHATGVSIYIGHNSAADNQILGVRFGEITADGYR